MDDIDRYSLDLFFKRISERLDKTDEQIRRFATQALIGDIKVLDNQDMCLLLKINIRTLQRYREKGHIKSFRLGGKTFYKVSEVKKFLSERV